jgi:hypothetical protein
MAETQPHLYVGVGLNPALARPPGWMPADDRVPGTVFLALGENRYMGGPKESAPNYDFMVRGATFRAGTCDLVRQERVAQWN